MGTLEVVDTNGQNMRTLHTFDFDSDIFDIVLYYNDLYMITDGDNEERIMRIPKDGSSQPVSAPKYWWNSPTGLAIIFCK